MKTAARKKKMTFSNSKTFNSIKKIVSILIGMMMLLMILTSAYFLAHEAMHKCDDEDCPVCECIHICEEALKRLSNASEVFVALMMFGVILSADNEIYEPLLMITTPVNRKIRLND